MNRIFLRLLGAHPKLNPESLLIARILAVLEPSAHTKS